MYWLCIVMGHSVIFNTCIQHTLIESGRLVFPLLSFLFVWSFGTLLLPIFINLSQVILNHSHCTVLQNTRTSFLPTVAYYFKIISKCEDYACISFFCQKSLNFLMGFFFFNFIYLFLQCCGWN
jgi:hypothetical protein